MSEQRSFFSELKRRNVYKVAVAYAVVSWLLVQVASIVFPTFDAPPAAMKILIVLLAVGFPIALAFSWAFEITPEGIKRESEVESDRSITRRTGRKIVATTVLLAAIAAGLLAWQLFRGGTRSVASPAADKSTDATERVPPEQSIAVLPFENLSEDKANAFFASGIQDEILTRLAKINSLKVISRTSTQQYQSKPSSVGEIAKQLGVTNILEGSVQKVGNAVHINVQLIKAATDTHLWAESYNRKLDDIFGVEAEVATAIAEQLNAKLSGSEKKELTQRSTDNPAAYEAYLRGVTQTQQDAADSSVEAGHSFEEAVRLDPKFALAWAALSRAHGLAYLNNRDTSASRRAAAERAVSEAVRLQPQLQEVQLARATYQYVFLRDFKGAREQLQQLRMTWPSNAEIVALIGWISARLGEYEKCADYLDQANALNPRDLFLRRNTIQIHIAMRDFATALRMADDARQIWPESFIFEAMKARIFHARGELAEAQSIVDRITPKLIENLSGGIVAYDWKLRRTAPPASLVQQFESVAGKSDIGFRNAANLAGWAQLLESSEDQARSQAVFAQLRDATELLLKQQPDNSALLGFRAYAYAGLGEREAALNAADQAMALTSNDGRLHGQTEELKARLLARFGDKEHALPLLQHLLEISYDGFHSAPLTPALLRLDPDFDSLRGDPSFEKLCQEKQP